MKKQKNRIPIDRVELREATTISWNEKKQCIEFLNSNGEVSNKHIISIGEGHERENKIPKILKEFPSKSGGSLHRNEIMTFDKFMSIDTSYKRINEYFICSTGVVIIENFFEYNSLKKGEVIHINVPERPIFLTKQTVKPERYGWMIVIKSLTSYHKFDEKLKYGIIVDSDLADLQQINKKELPIFGNYYCPDNVSLLYSSADRGSDFSNKLIKYADKVANNDLKKAIEEFNDPENTELNDEIVHIGKYNYRPDIDFQF